MTLHFNRIKKGLYFKLLLLFCAISLGNLSAQEISGRVVDASSGEALPYASVAIQGSSKGAIANADGYFLIESKLGDDLLASFVGYETLKIKVENAEGPLLIKLKPAVENLSEVLVLADDSWIYDLIGRVQKYHRSSDYLNSKAYLKFQSDEGNHPIELIESCYNALSRSSGVEELKLKNGRAGLYIEKNKSFHSRHSSLLLERLDILDHAEDMPYNPFQLRPGENRKYYAFTQTGSIGDSVVVVQFSPKEGLENFFSGRAWIDRKEAKLLKIKLEAMNSSAFPLAPIWDGDELDSTYFHYSISFSRNEGSWTISHLDFDYSFNYLHGLTRQEGGDPFSRQIRARGILVLYDFDSPFILPRYEYPSNLNDYHKMALLSINSDFWKVEGSMPNTRTEQERLAYFGMKGLLLNHFTQNSEQTRDEENTIYTTGSIVWRDSIRLNVIRDIRRDSLSPLNEMTSNSFVYTARDPYALVVQLYLDVNRTDSGLQFYTATVFDAIQSHYNKEVDSLTNIFFNIYFDLCEIERRKMLDEIRSGPQELDRMLEIHARYSEDIVKLRTEYAIDVDDGRNAKRLEHWNALVKEKLGIDNLEMFSK